MKSNFNYKYRTDPEKYQTSLDIWEVISPDSQGIYEGDCESYCRTLKNLYKDFYKDFEYWYCLLDGVGHCVLIKDNSIIEDCNCQTPMSIEKYKEIYNVSNFKKLNWFTVFSKFLFGKILSTIKGN